MESIKIGLFDLFAYTIPGVIAMIIVAVICGRLDCADMSKIGLIPAVLLFVAAYLTGFVTAKVGEWVFKGVEAVIPLPKPRNYPKERMTTSYKYCLLRDLSPENYRSIEGFNVMKKMASNLGVIVFAGSVVLVCVGKICYCGLLAGIGLSAIFFASAWKFGEWVVSDLDNAVDVTLRRYGMDNYL
jgi:hypothetical protein